MIQGNMATSLFNNLAVSFDVFLIEYIIMSKNHLNIASRSMHQYAAKFLKATDAQTQRRGLACKAFALVYSDRALSRV